MSTVLVTCVFVLCPKVKVVFSVCKKVERSLAVTSIATASCSRTACRSTSHSVYRCCWRTSKHRWACLLSASLAFLPLRRFQRVPFVCSEWKINNKNLSIITPGYPWLKNLYIFCSLRYLFTNGVSVVLHSLLYNSIPISTILLITYQVSTVLQKT